MNHQPLTRKGFKREIMVFVDTCRKVAGGCHMRGFEALPDYVWAVLSWSALGLSSPTTARFVSKNGNADDNDQLFKVKMKIEKKLAKQCR